MTIKAFPLRPYSNFQSYRRVVVFFGTSMSFRFGTVINTTNFRYCLDIIWQHHYLLC